LAVYDGWVLDKGHPSVPWVSLVLIVLSVLVAVETTYAYYSKKIRAKKMVDSQELAEAYQVEYIVKKVTEKSDKNPTN